MQKTKSCLFEILKIKNFYQKQTKLIQSPNLTNMIILKRALVKNQHGKNHPNLANMVMLVEDHLGATRHVRMKINDEYKVDYADIK